MFDATDLEIARREHDAEMGAETPRERNWYRYADRVEAEIVRRGWGSTLDADQWVEGYSLDTTHDAFTAGQAVAAYIEWVAENRRSMGLAA